MSSIVQDVINSSLAASSSPTAESAKRLFALEANMQAMPACQRTLRDLGLAETAVLAAQRGEVFSMRELDAALEKAGIRSPRSLEFKMQLRKCGLLAR